MDSIMAIVKKHGLCVIEDCAQSHGVRFNGQMTGVFGDAGAIVINDPEIAEDVRVFRNYGSEKRYYNRVVGTNPMLDEPQAGLLCVRLSHMQELEENSLRDKRAIVIRLCILCIGFKSNFLNVLSDNTPAIYMYRKCGFQYEGEFNGHLFLCGKYHNLQWYAISRGKYIEKGIHDKRQK